MNFMWVRVLILRIKGIEMTESLSFANPALSSTFASPEVDAS